MIRRVLHVSILTILVIAGVTAQQSQLPNAGRERLSINTDWRFIKGDPPGTTASLLYDVRPDAADARDDRPADAEPERFLVVDATLPTVDIAAAISKRVAPLL